MNRCVKQKKTKNGVTYLDLSLHCDCKQDDEIHDKDRPEHWDVQSIKQSTE